MAVSPVGFARTKLQVSIEQIPQGHWERRDPQLGSQIVDDLRGQLDLMTPGEIGLSALEPGLEPVPARAAFYCDVESEASLGEVAEPFAERFVKDCSLPRNSQH